jgi:hypothetical protein
MKHIIRRLAFQSVARCAGLEFPDDSLLGLTPEAGVPSRASRLGWKSLRCRLLRRLFPF